MVVFIARGRGILVGILAYGCLFATEFLTERHFHDDTYYQRHGWPKLLAFGVAALLVWLIEPHGSDEDPASHLKPAPFDAHPSRSILRSEDSFFLISVRYWPWILCALGVAFYLAGDVRW